MEVFKPQAVVRQETEGFIVQQVVIIPFGYEDLPSQVREHLVPICIRSVDPRGRLIPMAWFENGVAPVHGHLVAMARWKLGDPWRVSELVELTLYTLFDRHGTNLGECPWRRVLREAFWLAADLKAGGTRAERNHRALEVSIDRMKDDLVDPTDYADRYTRDLLLDSVEAKLQKEGLVRMEEVYCLVRLGHTWNEIAQHFGESSEDVLKRQFYRWARKAQP